MIRTIPPKGTQQKKTGGRPPLSGISYRRMYNRIAELLCKENGATIRSLAKAFGVYPDDITCWFLEHPSFKRAVDRGRDAFDSENVERSLRQRALGFTYDEKEYVRVAEYNDQGECVGYKMQLVRVKKKHLPGNIKAQTFWLTNRYANRWQHKRDVKENEYQTVPDEMTAQNELERLLSALAERLPD